jgi:hypothetical protein
MTPWFVRFTKLFSWTGYKAMKLKLIRVDATDHGMFGHLSCDSNPFNCLTLERHDVYIPVGSYRVTLYNSPHNKRVVPLLHDVPGRDMIEIHIGNWETDSKGCILVGMSRDGNTGLSRSKEAFEGLMKVLEGCDDIWLKVV